MCLLVACYLYIISSFPYWRCLRIFFNIITFILLYQNVLWEMLHCYFWLISIILITDFLLVVSVPVVVGPLERLVYVDSFPVLTHTLSLNCCLWIALGRGICCWIPMRPLLCLYRRAIGNSWGTASRTTRTTVWALLICWFLQAQAHWACLGCDGAEPLLNESREESIRTMAVRPNPAHWSCLGDCWMRCVWMAHSLSGWAAEAETAGPGDQALHWEAGGGRAETLAHHRRGWRGEGAAEEGIRPGRSALS